MSQIEDTIILSDSDETSSTIFDESDASLDSAAKLEGARRWQREQRERDEEDDNAAAAAATRRIDGAKVPVTEEKRPQEQSEKKTKGSEDAGQAKYAPLSGAATSRISAQHSKPQQEAPGKTECMQNASTHRIASNTPAIPQINPHSPPHSPYISSLSEHPAPPPPTTKYAFNPSQKLCPDNGSMDAFIDTAFDEGLSPPVIVENGGSKAPVAVMYDNKEPSAVKQGTRAAESCVKDKTVRGTKPSILGGSETVGGPNGGKKVAGSEGLVWRRQQAGDKSVQNARVGGRGDGGRVESSGEKQVCVSGEEDKWCIEKETGPKLGFAALAAKKKDVMSAAEGERQEGDGSMSSSAAAAAAPEKKNDNAPGHGPCLKDLKFRKKAPSTGIPLSTTAPSRSRKVSGKRRRQNNDVPEYQTSVLNGNRKRTLAQIPVGELFNTKQIISETELKRRKRQRRVSESERRAKKVDALAEETRFDTGQTVRKQEPDFRECQGGPSDSEQKAPEPEFRGGRGPASIDVHGDRGLKGLHALSHVNLVEDDDDVPITIEEVACEKDGSTNSNIGGSPALSHASLFLEDAGTEVTSAEEQGETDKDTDAQNGALTAATAGSEPIFLSGPSAHRPLETVQQAIVLDNDCSTSGPRSTIARKTISPDLLAALNAAPAIYSDPDFDSGNEDGPNSPKAPPTTRKNLNKSPLVSFTEGEILYEYHVIRSDFGPNVPEDNAVTTLFGPYHTLEEANESAKMEAGRSYEEMHAAERREGRRYLGKEEGVGCEIGMVVDAEWCHTWRCVRGEGRGVVARVERGELLSFVVLVSIREAELGARANVVAMRDRYRSAKISRGFDT